MSRAIKSHQPCNDCGSSDALDEYIDGTHCFSCLRTRKFAPRAFNRVPDYPKVMFGWDGQLVLPRYEEPWSNEAAKWLGQYNLTGALIHQYQIGYSGGRIILPVFQQGKLQGYQARSFVLGEPKYRTYGEPGIFVSSSGPWPYEKSRAGRKCVIVEDIISAIRVGQTCDAVALLGLKLSLDHLLTLVSSYDMIGIWLDPDQRGQSAAKTIATQLAPYVKKCINFKSESDPKCYFNTEIKSILDPLLVL